MWYKLNSWCKFGYNFLSKSSGFIISEQSIPVSVIDRRDKISNCIFNTIKIIQIIGLSWFNLFVQNIFCHEFQRVFDILVSEAICLIELWSVIGWKPLFQISRSIGALGSYGSEMLMNVLFSFCYVGIMLGFCPEPC